MSITNVGVGVSRYREPEQPMEFQATELFGPGWGTVFEYQKPRRYELGVRLEF